MSRRVSRWDPPASQGSWVTGIDEAAARHTTTISRQGLVSGSHRRHHRRLRFSTLVWRLRCGRFSGVSASLPTRSIPTFRWVKDESHWTAMPVAIWPRPRGRKGALAMEQLSRSLRWTRSSAYRMPYRWTSLLPQRRQSNAGAPGGQWNVLNKDDRVTLQDGDQIGLITVILRARSSHAWPSYDSPVGSEHDSRTCARLD